MKVKMKGEEEVRYTRRDLYTQMPDQETEVTPVTCPQAPI